VSGQGRSQLTQACAARCTRPGHPRRNSAPHPPSPTGERQRPGSEGHSHPQCGFEPGTEGSACSKPGSWAALGRAKLLLLPPTTAPLFGRSCLSVLPQSNALSYKCSCLTVSHHWGFGPAQQHLPPPLLAARCLGAAPGCSPTGARDIGSSGGVASAQGAASTLALWLRAPVPSSHRSWCAAGLSLLLSQSGNGAPPNETATNGHEDGSGNPFSRPLQAGSSVSLP